MEDFLLQIAMDMLCWHGVRAFSSVQQEVFAKCCVPAGFLDIGNAEMDLAQCSL